MSSACGQHGLAAELRALALAALDRWEPALGRARAAAGTGGDPRGACPVCAVIAAACGERPELAARLAEQAAELLAVLRAALQEGGGDRPDGADHGGDGVHPPAPPPRRVQHIPVTRP